MEVHHVIWLSRGDKRWSRRKRLWLRKQQFIAVNDSTAVEIPRLFCFSMTNSHFPQQPWKFHGCCFSMESSGYYSYEGAEYVLAGSKEPVDTEAVLRLFRRYEGELFA